MSDLQDALDKYDKTGSAYGNVSLFVEAARKYANPDYEAALTIYDAASPNHPDEVSYVRAIVDAALSVTEDKSDEG